MAERASYRLPADVVPRHYAIEWRPDLDAARFEGDVTVALEVQSPTQTVVFNAAQLELGDVTLRTPAGDVIEGNIIIEEDEEQAALELARPLEPGAGYELHAAFAGTLNNQLRGFYLSSYHDSDGVEHVIAATQFEPADARRAFPCWDEPAFKATFAVAVVIDGDSAAFSNGAVVASEPLGDGRRRVRFAETMVMSTYLVALVVGPFELTGPVDVGGVPMLIAAVPGRSHLTAFAVRAGRHALLFLSDYFAIPYPGGKLDHIAIPDFAFGAMENLGCVTYRENVLLADPELASQVELQRVASVVAHETAHMWFGDLVTMKWWNGIWLNEAFATFMELLTTDSFEPGWQVWTAFGAGKSAAMAIDGLRATRPVEFEVGRPQEAEAMFDVLTYQKGGAVLRMLERYLGPDAFREGIAAYLRANAYGNTETNELWQALEGASGEPVTEIMHSWIDQAGFPLVSVDVEQSGTVTLSQRRFVYDGMRSEELWHIPVRLRAGTGGTGTGGTGTVRQQVLLDEATTSVELGGDVAWLVANDGFCGFYRTRYSPAAWEMLRSAGVRNVMEPLERVGLVSDTWAQVVAGIAELAEWVSVADTLSGDEDPDVWNALTGVFATLDGVGDAADRAALRAFVRSVAGPSWSTLGWEPTSGEDHRRSTARARVLAVLGLTGGDDKIRAEASTRFEHHLDRGADRGTLGPDRGVDGLAPDLVSPAARIAVSAGGRAAWSRVLDAYRSSSNPQERIRYLYALSEADDMSDLSRTLDLTVGPDVRLQDAPYVISMVLARREASTVAWSWVEEHWKQIRSHFPDTLTARICEGVTHFAEPLLADRVHAFAATHQMPMPGPRMNQILERMDINVSLAARLQSKIATAFTP